MHDFRRRLQAGLLGRIENADYLAWVRSLGCVATGCPADHAHHRYGGGFIKGAGTKAPDYFAIPLTAREHEALHADVPRWEDRHGSQWYWIAMTLLRAVVEGRLVWRK